MLTPAGFKLRFPEFASVADECVQMVIDENVFLFNADVWGNQLDTGMGYVVAHELSQANQPVATKATASDIVGKKVGEVQITRDPVLLSQQIKDPYLRTLYGQKYRRLQRLMGAGAIAV